MSCDSSLLYTQPGDPYLRPILDALNHRSAIIFVHPVSLYPQSYNTKCHSPDDYYPTSTPLASVYPAPMLEYFFDIGRSFTDLLVSGTARRFPNIKWIVTHCGDSLPSVIDRLVLFVDYFGAHFQEFRHGGKIRKENIECAVREQFWFDLAGNPLPSLVDALLKFSSKERLLFGSDAPWTSFKAAGQVVRHLEKDMRNGFGVKDREMIWRGNALRLLGKEDQRKQGQYVTN